MKSVNRLNPLLRAVLIAVAGFAAAAAGAGQDLAAVQVGAGSISWLPLADSGGLALTVSGGGQVFQHRFAAGESPSIELVDENGKLLPDGSYIWELRAIPAVAKHRSASDAQGGGPATTSAPTTQSGHFLVSEGAILDPAREETSRAKVDAGAAPTEPLDFVIADDLIVQGSTCTGLDCINNENFGFDTLKLKENNTRIKFEDTSNTASFPTNDWQITANDSTNGGAEKFSIDDITNARTPFTIRAGARNNAMFVDSSGRLGLGTATPVVNIHVVSGNTPTLRLDQDGSSGFTPQVWDVAGNEASFFIRDATNASRLPFRIIPGAANNSIFVGSAGNVGIDTNAPDATVNLHVRAFTGSPARLRVEPLTDGQSSFLQLFTSNIDWQFQNNAVNGSFAFRDVTNSVSPFIIEAGATQNVMTLTSAGQVRVKGVVVHPDYVFEPDYKLESIEEHAEAMWAKKHLPAVGAGTYDENGEPVIELAARSQGVLEELEKAHIYIEQLATAVRAKDARIARLEAANGEIAERLARLEGQPAREAAVE